MSFIGEKQVKSVETTDEKTPGGTEILKVEYEDGTREFFSKLMYDQIVTEESITLSDLRDKRVQPVVAMLLVALREWGLKLGELGYLSALLNRSLDSNRDAALQELWSKWMPRPLSVDDVDLITIDRVLKTINKNKDASSTDSPTKD